MHYSTYSHPMWVNVITAFSIVFQLLPDQIQLKHICTFFRQTLHTANDIYCCQLFSKNSNKNNSVTKKWHSKSCSRFCLIKMALFKEHDCIYLHSRNHSSNSCNAVRRAYINSSSQAGDLLEICQRNFWIIRNSNGRRLYIRGVRTCS